MRNRTVLGIAALGLAVSAALGTAATAFAAKSSSASTKTTASSTASAKQRPPRGPEGRRGPGGGLIEVVAKLTGETTSTVAAARESGTSFAAFAKTKGVTEAEIIELASHAPKAALDSMVADGLITQSAADTELAAFKAHLAEEITETGVRGPGGRGGRGHDGPPPAGAPGSGVGSSTTR
jgi:hypothetical protein